MVSLNLASHTRLWLYPKVLNITYGAKSCKDIQRSVRHGSIHRSFQIINVNAVFPGVGWPIYWIGRFLWHAKLDTMNRWLSIFYQHCIIFPTIFQGGLIIQFHMSCNKSILTLECFCFMREAKRQLDRLCHHKFITVCIFVNTTCPVYCKNFTTSSLRLRWKALQGAKIKNYANKKRRYLRSGCNRNKAVNF